MSKYTEDLKRYGTASIRLETGVRHLTVAEQRLLHRRMLLDVEADVPDEL